METIRIGIIGAGANTIDRHIPGLRALSNVEIVGVCNRSLESSQKVADRFGIPKIYDHWCKLVQDENIDAVVIGTWPYKHCQITIAALEKNKHVLCEARMANNAGEAHKMLKASLEKPHLVCQIVPSPLTLSIDKAIKRILAEDHIGKPLIIDIRDGNTFLDETAPLHWRQNFDLSGYNTMTLGILYESIMRWLGEATAVMAMGKIFVKMRRDEEKQWHAVRIPEHLDVIAEMACGAQMNMQISRVTGLAGPTKISLFGDKGTLKIIENKIFGAQKGATELKEIPLPPELEGHWRVEEEFINAISGKEKIKLTTFQDGVKYMEFTEAVLKSVQTHKIVNLPLS